MDRVFQQFRIERERGGEERGEGGERGGGGREVVPLPYYEIVSSNDDTSEIVIGTPSNEIEVIANEIEEVIQAPSNEIEEVQEVIANEIEIVQEVSRRPVRLRRQTVPFQQYMTRARRQPMIRTRTVITTVNPPVRVTCDKKNNKSNKNNKNNNKNPFYEDECPICWDAKAYIRTQCGHKFCSCLMQLIVNPKQTEYGPAECKCPLCRAPVKSVKFKNNDYYTLLKSVSSGLAGKIRCIS
jgi:hypothetical protein